MPDDLSQHIFRSPKFKSVVRDAIDFFAQTPVHSVPPPHRFKRTGVYPLYYSGNFRPYAKISALNQSDFTLPIYVGKAVPKGRRTARSIDSDGSELNGRLREHARSIKAATNLEIEHFQCRFMILIED